MTSKAARRDEEHRRQVLAAVRKEQARRGRQRRILVAVTGLAVLAGLVAAMMLTSRPTSSAVTRPAPGFTLTDTSGRRVALTDYRGRDVVLYFSEGAGCGSCLQQMAAIEKDRAAFDRAGLAVLPIVMNTREQILHDMALYGVKTPFLLDDGTVSTAYGTIGRGMHEGLPGHGFVLIDNNGAQRWHGEYPSMWLSPDELVKQASAHLAP
ncbi:MAG: peroxiredoxin family protein [Motilibacteraceae bacterium]